MARTYGHKGSRHKNWCNVMRRSHTSNKQTKKYLHKRERQYVQNELNSIRRLLKKFSANACL